MVVITEVIQQQMLSLFQFIEQLLSTNSVDHAANLFALKEFGNIYTRIMNPTNDVLEKRIAALEGGLSFNCCFWTNCIIVFNIKCCQAGDNIVSSTDLYGGTVSLFTHIKQTWY